MTDESMQFEVGVFPQWQPIEAAPRDGTTILVWHRVWKCPISVSYKLNVREDCPWLEKTLCTVWPDDAFTHWMPMLEPPK
jgi:hypothetical protein